MKNDLTNIPFETLPLETLRLLCERAVKSINDKETEDFSDVLNMDVRIAATVRLNNPHGLGKMWVRYREDKNATLALINTYIAMKGENGGRYIPIYSSDILPSLMLDREVANTILENPESFDIQRMTGDTGLFSRVTADMLIRHYETDPALVANIMAAYPAFMGMVSASKGWTMEKRMEVIKTALGFTHKWNNDTPAVLHTVMSHGVIPSPEFDDLMFHICTICRKDSANMVRIVRDLANDTHGGKASRHRSAGWVTEYMARLWEGKQFDIAKKIVQDIPPMLQLLPCKARANKEFRALKRLYQISGDYK